MMHQPCSVSVNPQHDRHDDSTDHCPPFSVRQNAPPPAHDPDAPPTAPFCLFQRDATSTSLFIALPPLQDEANVPVPVRQSIGAFEGEPGLAPDLRLLHLHPTLLNPRWPKDSMRTLTLTLPPLNPSASRDSRVDVVGVCGDPPRPLHLQSDSASTCTPRFNLDRTTTQRGRRHRPFLRLTLSPCATLSRLWTMFVALFLARCSPRARMRGSA